MGWVVGCVAAVLWLLCCACCVVPAVLWLLCCGCGGSVERRFLRDARVTVAHAQQTRTMRQHPNRGVCVSVHEDRVRRRAKERHGIWKGWEVHAPGQGGAFTCCSVAPRTPCKQGLPGGDQEGMRSHVIIVARRRAARRSCFRRRGWRERGRHIPCAVGSPPCSVQTTVRTGRGGNATGSGISRYSDRVRSGRA